MRRPIPVTTQMKRKLSHWFGVCMTWFFPRFLSAVKYATRLFTAPAPDLLPVFIPDIPTILDIEERLNVHEKRYEALKEDENEIHKLYMDQMKVTRGSLSYVIKCYGILVPVVCILSYCFPEVLYCIISGCLIAVLLAAVLCCTLSALSKITDLADCERVLNAKYTVYLANAKLFQPDIRNLTGDMHFRFKRLTEQKTLGKFNRFRYTTEVIIWAAIPLAVGVILLYGVFDPESTLKKIVAAGIDHIFHELIEKKNRLMS